MGAKQYPDVHLDRRILATQPRRIAAVAVANRVCQEMEVEVGRLVGYTHSGKKKTVQNKFLKYRTDSLFVRETISNRYPTTRQSNQYSNIELPPSESTS